MDELDFEPEEDDVATTDNGQGAAAAPVKGFSTKGRGHGDSARSEGRGGVFESLDGHRGGAGEPAPSVEGWILFVRGVHEEAQEDDILDKFSEYGDVRNINVNLDRHTGFVKGYALVEFAEKKQAQEALEECNGSEVLGQKISVDWAFVQEPGGGGKGKGGNRNKGRR